MLSKYANDLTSLSVLFETKLLVIKNIQVTVLYVSVGLVSDFSLFREVRKQDSN